MRFKRYYSIDVKINNKCIFNRSWKDEGILKLMDICSEDGNILTFHDFRLKYSNVKCTFIKYCGLLKALPRAWKQLFGCDLTHEIESHSLLIHELCNNKKHINLFTTQFSKL